MKFHNNRVDMLCESGEYDKWLADLKKAGDVPLDNIDEVLFIQHLPKLWQEKVLELRANGVPDKTIAKMISQTQTAKKGETRAALMATAPGRPAPEPNATHKEDAGENVTLLDNAFASLRDSGSTGGLRPRSAPEAGTEVGEKKRKDAAPAATSLPGKEAGSELASNTSAPATDGAQKASRSSAGPQKPTTKMLVEGKPPHAIPEAEKLRRVIQKARPKSPRRSVQNEQGSRRFGLNYEKRRAVCSGMARLSPRNRCEQLFDLHQ